MTTINNSFKSKVMKAAWTSIRNGFSATMSEALFSAWAWAKKNLVEKFKNIHSIEKETEKAILAVVGFKFNHVLEATQKITMWVPKSLVVNNQIPEWFYNKNVN